MTKTFPGGRRWPAGDFFYRKSIEPAPRPEWLYVPLWRGGRAEVEPGGRVKPYSLIGYDGQGLPVHAPLGGKVHQVGDFPHLVGRPRKFDFPRLTVTIDVDRRAAEPEPPYRPLPRFWELTHRELCQRLFEAGVMDVCHADLPRVVLFNGLDLEPPLAANLRLLEERTAELLEGMRIIMQLHQAQRSRIALARGFPALEARLRTMLASSVNLSLEVLDPVYPQGHQVLLSAALSPDGVCSIYDMAAVLRTREAVVLGKPVTTSFCTLWNEAGGRASVTEVPVGAPARQVLGEAPAEHSGTAAAGEGPVSRADTARPLTLVFGGLLSGRSFYSLEMPVQADTDGVLLFGMPKLRQTQCFNCGACHRRCPSGLHPSEIQRQVAKLDLRRLGGLGLDRCLECGLCSWICPAKIDLLQQIGVGRMLLEGKL